MTDTIKLSEDTISLFTSISKVNQSVRIPEGDDKIMVVAVGGKTLVTVAIPEDFPRDVYLYDMNEFLGALSLVKEPNIDFSEDSTLLITENGGNPKIRFIEAEERLVDSEPPNRSTVEEDDIIYEVKVEQDVLDRVNKAANVLKLPYIGFKCEEGIVSLIAFDNNNGSEEETGLFSIKVGEHDDDFLLFMKQDMFHVHAGDYEVKLSSKLRMHMKNTTAEIDYVKAFEKASEV
mgnify:CR=1 FL=1